MLDDIIRDRFTVSKTELKNDDLSVQGIKEIFIDFPSVTL